MIILLSPSKTLAKNLDFDAKPASPLYTVPEFLKESKQLVDILRTYSPAKLAGLMEISDKLAVLNVSRYQQFITPFTPENAKQAIFSFKGDVYEPINVELFHSKQLEFTQKNIRILSGLYGLLKPMDLIQPYRLEMGIKLATPKGKGLYQFWGDRITLAINRAMIEAKTHHVVNLASEEYFSAVMPKKLAGAKKRPGELIHIVFKENHKGSLKIIGLFAKKARGMMTNFVIKEQISAVEDLKEFTEGGYRYMPNLSDTNHWVFSR